MIGNVSKNMKFCKKCKKNRGAPCLKNGKNIKEEKQKLFCGLMDWGGISGQMAE